MSAEPVNVELRNASVEFRVGRERLALNYRDFSLRAGDHAVILGPSGSGKTTLLHLLAGLITPASGSVTVGPFELNRMNERARDRYRARTIGYLFQDFHLQSDFTATENVILGLGLAGVAAPQRSGLADKALEAVDLASHAHRPVRRMSTGERQRVALARAVAHSPGLLLADEPTAHLDRSRAEQALNLLRDTARRLNVSLLVATHDPLVMDAFTHRIEVAS